MSTSHSHIPDIPIQNLNTEDMNTKISYELSPEELVQVANNLAYVCEAASANLCKTLSYDWTPVIVNIHNSISALVNLFSSIDFDLYAARCIESARIMSEVYSKLVETGCTIQTHQISFQLSTMLERIAVLLQDINLPERLIDENISDSILTNENINQAVYETQIAVKKQRISPELACSLIALLFTVLQFFQSILPDETLDFIKDAICELNDIAGIAIEIEADQLEEMRRENDIQELILDEERKQTEILNRIESTLSSSNDDLLSSETDESAI